MPSAAYADVVTFTFEGLATQSGLTTLTLSGGGLTATLTRPGSVFAISDQSPFAGLGFPASWGTRTLDPFGDPTSNTAFLLNFSQAITSLAIDMGDFGGDADVLTLQLFSGLDGTGSLLGTSTLGLSAGGFAFSFMTPTLTTTPALSARFIGGSAAGPNSVYYDNIRATFGATTATPEPATFALFASGLLGVGLLRRRKRS
jgi:hypothetical protein